MPDNYTFDTNRAQRIGFDEAVFCLPKTVTQINTALEFALGAPQRMLFTRLSPDKFQALRKDLSSRVDYDAESQTAVVGAFEVAPVADARVAVVTAGTSDMCVAKEAVRTLAYYGVSATLFSDIGVAGLWRLLEQRDRLASFDVVIAVAGMEGALFSVLAGLIPSLIIAVPTSTGYGVAAGGHTALHSALGGCGPGVVAVNVDNGYGAACAALRVVLKSGTTK